MAASNCRGGLWRTLKGLGNFSNTRDVNAALPLTFSLLRKLHMQSGQNAQQEVSPDLSHTGPEALETQQAREPIDGIEAQLENVLKHDDYFQLKDLVTMKSLYEARVHLGHNAGLRHPSMSPFIFGERLGQDVIDLEQTLPRLQEALNVCAHIVYRGGMVMFLSRNQQILPWVERTAKEVGEYSHCRAWRRGTFTNAANIFNTLPIYPELCIFLTTQDTVFEQHRGVVESSKLLIPSIGVVDTNCDVDNVTFPIPGNDDTADALHLFLGLFRTAVMRAKEWRKLDGVERETPV